MARLLLFNKPFGVLSQFTDRGSPTLRSTLSNFIEVPDVYPAGRLDRELRESAVTLHLGAATDLLALSRARTNFSLRKLHGLISFVRLRRLRRLRPPR